MVRTHRISTPTGTTANLRAGEVRVLPFGGDVVVARSIAEAHRRNPWTGRCRACRERHPCRDSRHARIVLGAAAEPPGRQVSMVGVSAVVVPVLVGVLLIAASIAGLAR